MRAKVGPNLPSTPAWGPDAGAWSSRAHMADGEQGGWGGAG